MFRRKTRAMMDRLSHTIRVTPYQFKQRRAPGLAPGTLVVADDAHQPQIDVMAYTLDEVVVQHNVDVNDLTDIVASSEMTWINVVGLGDAEVIRALGSQFKLHSLALEDVLNVHQRPKTEDYDDYAYMVLRMSSLDGNKLNLEQVSVFVLPHCVITIQERPGDCFDPLRSRISKAAVARKKLLNADYLAYALVDAVIDSNFPILERYDELLVSLEDDVLFKADQHCIAQIHHIKHDLHLLRRAIWPHREAIRRLEEDTDLISAETHVFLRDCEDHVVQLLDIVEAFAERASSLNDLYLSSVSQRTNEIMKTLTIFATITMPVSTIASIYGMNFHTDNMPFNMPELSWEYGYLYALSLMVGVTCTMLVYFWRKRWIGASFGRGGD